jgi:hypothetical protein
MRYRLRTLLILMAIGPPLVAVMFGWTMPPEISWPILIALSQLVPPLLVAAFLGFLAMVVFQAASSHNRQ